MAGGRGGRRGWLALIVLLFGGILAAGRLAPAVRWFFRQRADKVVEEVRRRGIELPTFKLTRRGTLIYRLTHDPELLEAAKVYARENGISMAVAMARVERYAREIVPSFNAFLYFRVGIPLAAWISRSLYDVRVGPQGGLAALDENAVEDASVVFVMNHRSNIDYVLLAHLRKTTTVKLWTQGPRCHRGYSSPAAVRPSTNPSPACGGYDRSILDRDTPCSEAGRLSICSNAESSGLYSYWTASTMPLRAAERAGRRPAKMPMKRPESRAARAGSLG